VSDMEGSHPSLVGMGLNVCSKYLSLQGLLFGIGMSLSGESRIQARFNETTPPPRFRAKPLSHVLFVSLVLTFQYLYEKIGRRDKELCSCG
jgi:hypothetical protein